MELHSKKLNDIKEKGATVVKPKVAPVEDAVEISDKIKMTKMQTN